MDTPAPDPESREGSLPDVFAIKVSVTPQTLVDLFAGFEIDVGDRPHVEPLGDEQGTLYAFASEHQVRELEAAGYLVEVGENTSETGRLRMAEMAEGDRFDGGRVAPQGLGRKPGRRGKRERPGSGPGGEMR